MDTTILLENIPEIMGTSRKPAGALYAALACFQSSGRHPITVSSSQKSAFETICSYRQFREYTKVATPKLSSHEIAKRYTVMNFRVLAVLLGDLSILRGVGMGAKISANNIDDAADALHQAIVYHIRNHHN